MYEFISIQYKMGQIGDEQLAKLVALGRITKEQADAIKAGE